MNKQTIDKADKDKLQPEEERALIKEWVPMSNEQPAPQSDLKTYIILLGLAVFYLTSTAGSLYLGFKWGQIASKSKMNDILIQELRKQIYPPALPDNSIPEMEY